MAYEGSESTQDNFGKFIHQFQPEIKTLIGKLERILIISYRQNVSLLFNQTCLNERLLSNYTFYIYIYIHFIITMLVVTKSLCGFVLDQVQYNMESAQYLG